MKERFVITTLLLLVFAFSAFAQERFGLGVIVGEPTGISGKLRLSRSNSVDAALAWSFRRNGHFHVHADYLWEFPNTIRASEQFTLFAGLGGRLTAGKGDGVLGLRIAGGFAWLPRNTPLEVFLEVAPILDIIPATEFTANGGLGIRFFF